MRKYLPDIAWETEVWCADAPDHLIHFNGERFLGPYDSLTEAPMQRESKSGGTGAPAPQPAATPPEAAP